MEITYELEKEDIIKFRKYIIFVNPPKSTRNWNLFVIRFVISLGTYYFLFGWKQEPFLIKVLSLFLWITFVVLTIIAINRLSTLYLIRQNIPKSGVICQHTITLTETKLIEKTDVSASHYSWEGMDRIEENDDYLFIFVDTLASYIIPKRAFKTTSEYEAFYEFVKNKIPQKNNKTEQK